MSYPIVASIYKATIDTGTVRYRQIPTGAAGIAVADDALWDQIVDNTIMTTEHWLGGLNVGAPALGITADTEEVIALGTGGANGAAVAAATLLVEHDALYTIDTAVGEYPLPPIYLPVPIRVAALLRYAGQISSSITGGMAISLGFSSITGLNG